MSPGDLTYGSSRVHQMLIEGVDINIEVFRRFGEAMEWLNITLVDE